MDFRQIPIGLAMALAQNSDAMKAYAELSREVRSTVPARAHCARSKAEMGAIVSEIAAARGSSK